MSNKFLYEVRPVKPVVTPDGRSMRRPFSSLLSKEEVTAYMKAANIYRRFPDITEPIKVTGATLDELHREKFNVIVVEAPVEESPEGEITGEEIIDTPEKGIEEVVEESSVIEEEVVEEPTITEEVQEENITETVIEEPVEEVVESVEEEKVEEVVEETPVEEPVVEDVQEDQNEAPAPVVTEEVATTSQETSAPVAPKAATIQMNHGYHNNKKKHHH